MGKKITNQLGIYCNTCKLYTQSESPVMIKRINEERFDMRIRCFICKALKYKRLNINQRKLLPKEIIEMEVGKEIVDNFEKDGGLLPIIPLIAAIISGITALTGVAGVSTNAVLKAKENSETERHHKELENIAKGNGITEDEQIKNAIEFLSGRGFNVFIN